MSSLTLILILPLVFAVAMMILPKNLKTLNLAHIVFNAIGSFAMLYCVKKVVLSGTFFAHDKFLFLDSIGAIFLSIIAITGFLVNLYATTYFKWEVEDGHLEVKDVKKYYCLSYIFIFTMTLSVVANNLAFMWSAIEATTLSSVFLVAIYKNKKSVESGYKYIVLCSIGLAFALYATIILYADAHSVLKGDDAMLFTTVLANSHLLSDNALKLIFIFVLIGFGTKAGLVPTHTWLPDVHAQGPAPTSALLSGILLKCAMLGLIRYYAIVGNGVGFVYVEELMIVSGVITLFVAAFFLIRQHDVKRMFAYHSIAHMGVIAFGLGVGGIWGVAAALFHCVAHSFTKALAFCSTGNIARIYGTKDMTKMGGMIRLAPVTTVLFGIAICSLVGVPGFAIFVSEFMIFKAASINESYLLMGIFALSLTIIFIADFSHFFLASFGEVKGEVKFNGEMKFKENLPLIILAILVIAFGILNFDSFVTLLNESVKTITKQPEAILL
ncbi:proton-conducting transporter membrane subunit [Campylobacter geochelonis]|uniref:Hydrogenase-4 component F n=1 Tax=Campylobacter geochelonis TaxID=1780362 RepID=A0A128EC98_9BACT|nr:proton-conducting transporter membrane subunit [Campylobacter geochelonis]QKF72143.1 hydrogenase-4, antiporter-like subunit [Campylobacter geochelonis]CZE45982.1 hydrogenase-4 component F [Campylobacter geochelonis]CZE46642.1 hydrogenase-4 component F [Campylobacter geochelonis]CZE49773.1 hydrogenase-4 component F [Campylobacter geochelonis]